MKKLSSLIKARRMVLDERRKILAQLLDHKEAILEQKRILKEGIMHEEDIARQDVTAALHFGAYVNAALDAERAMDKNVAKMDGAIQIAQDKVHAAFEEVKRYEIYQENQDEQLRQELVRKETQQMDEVAIGRFK